jgi:hypothetical protein
VSPRPFPWVFPYVVERDAEDHPLGRTVLRPLVEVRVRGPGGISNKYAALVDSGSDYTLAAPIVALEAGIDLRSGRQTAVQVGGGHRSVSVVDTTLQLCDPQFGQEGRECEPTTSHDFDAEVGFFEHWDDPPFLVILGQVGFFDRFAVSLSRFSQVIVVDYRETLDRHVPYTGKEDGAVPD